MEDNQTLQSIYDLANSVGVSEEEIVVIRYLPYMLARVKKAEVGRRADAAQEYVALVLERRRKSPARFEVEFDPWVARDCWMRALDHSFERTVQAPFSMRNQKGRRKWSDEVVHTLQFAGRVMQPSKRSGEKGEMEQHPELPIKPPSQESHVFILEAMKGIQMMQEGQKKEILYARVQDEFLADAKHGANTALWSLAQRMFPELPRRKAMNLTQQRYRNIKNRWEIIRPLAECRTI